MAKAKWAAFPHPAKDFAFPGEALKKNWGKLHQGDCEPFPKDPKVQEAWRLYHQGKFAEAYALGLEAGGAGLVAAIKAQAIYANSLETREATQIAFFEEAMDRAGELAKKDPKLVNAHYLFAYAAGRYSQRISVAKALAQGFGGRIKSALDAALALEPKHADAHIALGTWHAEIIEKVGALVGRLTYGASKEAGEEHFRKALKLGPDSPIAHVEYANGLVLMNGKKALAEAGRLYARAAAMTPRDAMEKLDVEMARAEIA